MHTAKLLRIGRWFRNALVMSWVGATVLTPAASSAATLPVLPLLMDTTYAAPTGNVITVNAGGNFQAALNTAALGDTIVLQAGATFTGPFTLPNKTTGSGWIYVRSSDYAKLPAPGNRVSPQYASNMPKIVVAAVVGAAVQTLNGSHHYRFVGIEFKPIPGNFVFSLIQIGNNDTSNSTLPSYIVIDRCYIHGDTVAPAGRRGVLMSGTNIAVVDSHISGFSQANADTQAIFGYQGSGPFKIVNNFLEGASENIIFGGSDPTIPNSVPSDIEIRGNHLFKRLSWIGAGLNVKNLLEFKNAQRVLVEGNIMENNWLDGQVGFSLLITPRNQDGAAPWSVTQDITIRNNRLINLGQGINILGTDNLKPSQITRRVLIENNFIDVTGLNNNPQARIFQLTGGPVDVTIRHNTAFTVANGTLGVVENVPVGDQFDFRDNIVTSGLYGLFGTGTSAGTGALSKYFTNFTFTKNVIVGGSGTYPAGNFFPANNSAVGFTNFATGNYSLAPTSVYRNAASDGKDIGADFAAIVAAGAGGVISGIAAPTNAKVQ